MLLRQSTGKTSTTEKFVAWLSWPIVSWGILEFRREACCLRVSSAEHHHPSMDRLFRMNPWIIITEENPLPHQHNHKLHNSSFLLVSSIHYYHEDRPISRYRSCCCGCHQQCVHSSFDAIKGFGRRCRFAEKLQYVPTTNFNFKIHWDWWSFQCRNLWVRFAFWTSDIVVWFSIFVGRRFSSFYETLFDVS